MSLLRLTPVYTGPSYIHQIVKWRLRLPFALLTYPAMHLLFPVRYNHVRAGKATKNPADGVLRVRACMHDMSETPLEGQTRCIGQEEPCKRVYVCYILHVKWWRVRVARKSVGRDMGFHGRGYKMCRNR
jgi:hypothetical protein